MTIINEDQKTILIAVLAFLSFAGIIATCDHSNTRIRAEKAIEMARLGYEEQPVPGTESATVWVKRRAK